MHVWVCVSPSVCVCVCVLKEKKKKNEKKKKRSLDINTLKTNCPYFVSICTKEDKTGFFDASGLWMYVSMAAVRGRRC